MALGTNGSGLPTALTVEQPQEDRGPSKDIEVPEAEGNTKPLKFKAGDKRYAAHDAYRAWHRTLGNGCFAWDADLIEFRQRRDANGAYSGPLEPVCITEETSVDTAAQVDSDFYLSLIWQRMKAQIVNLDHLAALAGIQFFVIVHDAELTRFAVYEPRTGVTVRQSKEEHAAFLRGL